MPGTRAGRQILVESMLALCYVLLCYELKPVITPLSWGASIETAKNYLACKIYLQVSRRLFKQLYITRA